MPSGPTSMKELAALGLDYAFITGAAKHLRAADLLTVHPKGGGATAHWTARDYLLLTTSLAGDQPSDAPTVAPALAQLPHALTVRERFSTTVERDGPIGFTFGGWFLSEVTHALGLTGDTLQQAVDASRSATITMSLFPYRIEVTFYGGGEDGCETYKLIFQAPPPPPVEGQNALLQTILLHVHKTPLWRERTTVIPYEIVFACASLLAKVPASAKAVPPSETGVTTAAPEREAPEPHHRAPAPLRENQPHAATGPSDSPKTTEIGSGVQSLSLASVRRPPTGRKATGRKDALHHAQVVQL